MADDGTGATGTLLGAESVTAPPAVPTAPSAQTVVEPVTPPSATADDASPWLDPARAETEIKRLRRERGDERIAAKQNAAEEAKSELLKTLQVALGGAPGNEPPTIDSLSKQVGTVSEERDAARNEALSAKREAAIVRAAAEKGVAPASIDYLLFALSRGDFADVALDADDFGGTLSTAIEGEIAKNPSLRASGASIGTGGPGFSGTGASGQITKAELDAMPYAKRVEFWQNNKTEYDRLMTQ